MKQNSWSRTPFPPPHVCHTAFHVCRSGLWSSFPASPDPEHRDPTRSRQRLFLGQWPHYAIQKSLAIVSNPIVDKTPLGFMNTALMAIDLAVLVRIICLCRRALVVVWVDAIQTVSGTFGPVSRNRHFLNGVMAFCARQMAVCGEKPDGHSSGGVNQGVRACGVHREWGTSP